MPSGCRSEISVIGTGGSPQLISVHWGLGATFPPPPTPPPRLNVTNTPASVATYSVCAGRLKTGNRPGPKGGVGGCPGNGGCGTGVTNRGGHEVGSVTTAVTGQFRRWLRR